jgi:hypothetical protein
VDHFEKLQAAISTSCEPVAWAIPFIDEWQRQRFEPKNWCLDRDLLWKVYSCPLCDQSHCHIAIDGWNVDWFAPIGIFQSGCDRGCYLLFPQRAKEALAGYNARHLRKVIPEKLRRDVMRKTNGRCWYCGDRYGEVVEHQIPIALGGTNDLTNLVPSCQQCNQRKRAKTVDHFRVAMGGGPFWAEREGFAR